MSVLLVKIWMVLLIIINVMILYQMIERIISYIKGKVCRNWTDYNRIMLFLFGAAFLPFTLCWLYIRRD